MYKLSGLIFLTFSVISQCLAESSSNGQPANKFKVVSLDNPVILTQADKYLLYLPKGYRSQNDKKWPLIVFLHGNGEKGTDLAIVRGLPFVIEQGMDIPFVVVAPQIREEDDHWSFDYVDAVVDHVVASQSVDTSRIYLTGGSLGGFGATMSTIAQPNRYAAVVPMAGGDANGTLHWKLGIPYDAMMPVNKKWYCAVTNVPMRAYHGVMDNMVPIQSSGELYVAWSHCGGKPELVAYPADGHAIYNKTFSDAGLYDWLLGYTNTHYQDDQWLTDLSHFKQYEGGYTESRHGDLILKVLSDRIEIILKKYNKTLSYLAINKNMLMGQAGMVEFLPAGNGAQKIQLARMGRFKKKIE